MSRKILIAAGGTGGHLFPAQSLAKELSALYQIDLLFTGGGLSKNKCFDQSAFNYRDISCSTFSLGPSIFKSALKILKGLIESIKIMRSYKPDLIIAFGSFHTFPTLIAALLLRKKIYLHEQNKVMGKVNHLFARFAKKLMVTFPQTIPHYPKKSILVKMPLKFQSSERVVKAQYRMLLGLNPNFKTILVCGGSQGAKSINHFFLKSLQHLKGYPFQVIHMIGGQEDLNEVREKYQRFKIKAYVNSFDPKMHFLMQASDFMIGRAGASIIAEIIELELPAILIPYPYAKGHQEHNADFVEDKVRGGIKIIEEHLNENIFSKLIVSFFNDENIKEYRHHMQKYKKGVSSEEFSQIISKDLSLERK